MSDTFLGKISEIMHKVDEYYMATLGKEPKEPKEPPPAACHRSAVPDLLFCSYRNGDRFIHLPSGKRIDYRFMIEDLKQNISRIDTSKINISRIFKGL